MILFSQLPILVNDTVEEHTLDLLNLAWAVYVVGMESSTPQDASECYINIHQYFKGWTVPHLDLCRSNYAYPAEYAIPNHTDNVLRPDQMHRTGLNNILSAVSP
jgi:hypothetical protein